MEKKDLRRLIKLAQTNNVEKFQLELDKTQKNYTKQEQLDITNRLLEIDGSLRPIHYWRYRTAASLGRSDIQLSYLQNYQKYASPGLLNALIPFAEANSIDKALHICKTLIAHADTAPHRLMNARLQRRIGDHSAAVKSLDEVLEKSRKEQEIIGALAYYDMIAAGSLDERMNRKKKFLPTYYCSTENKLAQVNLNNGITFYGSDFYSHVTSGFLLPLIRNLQREGISCRILSATQKNDQVTEVYRATCDFIKIERYTELEKYKGETDLLIDCGGFTSGSIASLGDKISPVQLSYLGYGDISSIKGIDGQITDKFSSKYISKYTWTHKLPNLYSYWPLRPPPSDADTISEEATFGVYGDPGKLSASFFQTLSDILDKSDGTIGFFHMDLKNSVYRKMLFEKLWAYNIDENRIFIGAETGITQRLNEYRKSRVLLDGFPFNNGTVACEAIFMGATMISLPNESIFERQGGSILMSAGQENNIAANRGDYIRLALEKAKEDKFPVDYFRKTDLFNPRKFAQDFIESFSRTS